jgi:GTP-binding protein LepA
MVFAGLYPVEGHQYAELREALEKLRLNDASFFTSPKRRSRWIRLPMRLPRPAPHGDRPGAAERASNMDLVTTAPGVLYRVTTTDGVVRRSTVRPSCPTPV